MKKLTSFLVALIFATPFFAAESDGSLLYSVDFSQTKLSPMPAGWRDLIDFRPTRNWLVDESGFARVILKEYVGDPTERDRLLRRKYLEIFGMKYYTALNIYDGGLSDGGQVAALRDVSVSARFKKSPDTEVTFGVVLRVRDRDNYYAARLVGRSQFELVKFADNKAEVLASLTTSRRILEGDVWTMKFVANGDLLSAFLSDEKGALLADVHAEDATFRQGAAGLAVTTFAAAAGFELRALGRAGQKFSQRQVAAANKAAADKLPSFEYPLVRVVTLKDSFALNTPFEKLSGDYDVVVAGGGTGGFGAAMQAARMGARVLWLEETDFIGGQMANAGVTSMDDGGTSGKNPCRERGLYREFHESAAQYYYNLQKDPFTAYHFNRQSEGGYEPWVARGVMYALMRETRGRQLAGKPVTLDLAVRTRVVDVKKNGNAIVGATIEEWTESGPRKREVSCRVIVDATEYGDVLPLAGARYRVGTSTSDNVDPKSPMQDHTWLGIVKEYPEGIPEHLKFPSAPKLAQEMAKRFGNYALYGYNIWGVWVGANDPDPKVRKGTGVKPRYWRGYIDWRGMPDSFDGGTGTMSEFRHTRGGLNGGNDYPVTAGTAEDYQQRLRDEGYGIERTLGIVYFFQKTLGVNWSFAEDEGYATPYNIAKMRERGIREDLIPLAAMLPQLPYAREARRIVGVETLVGRDFYVRDMNGVPGKQWPSAVAINDYSFDLHGTEDSLEAGLDEKNYINGTGPVGVPFGVFIPEKIDGLVPAEKNISQSRLVNGATRLQPSTMLNGQAAGAIAALSVLKKCQPRQLNIIDVQTALLAAGDTLQSRWFGDVAYGTQLWRATQLLALYGIMDQEDANMLRNGPFGETARWGADKKPDSSENAATLKQLAKIIRDKSQLPSASALMQFPTRAALAVHLAGLVEKHGRYHVTDAPPYESAAYKKALAAAIERQGKKAGGSSKAAKAEKKKAAGNPDAKAKLREEKRAAKKKSN